MNVIMPLLRTARCGAQAVMQTNKDRERLSGVLLKVVEHAPIVAQAEAYPVFDRPHEDSLPAVSRGRIVDFPAALVRYGNRNRS